MLELAALRPVLPMPATWFALVGCACIAAINYPVLINFVRDPLTDVFTRLNSVRSRLGRKEIELAAAQRNVDEFDQNK